MSNAELCILDAEKYLNVAKGVMRDCVGNDVSDVRRLMDQIDLIVDTASHSDTDKITVELDRPIAVAIAALAKCGMALGAARGHQIRGDG